MLSGEYITSLAALPQIAIAPIVALMSCFINFFEQPLWENALDISGANHRSVGNPGIKLFCNAFGQTNPFHSRITLQPINHFHRRGRFHDFTCHDYFF